MSNVDLYLDEAVEEERQLIGQILDLIEPVAKKSANRAGWILASVVVGNIINNHVGDEHRLEILELDGQTMKELFQDFHSWHSSEYPVSERGQ